MSDIIKFRVWYRDSGDWYDSLHSDTFDLEALLKVSVAFRQNNVRIEAYEQFTGLYDHCGQEIYKGDVIIALDKEGVPYWYDDKDRPHLCHHCGIGPVEWLNNISGWYVAGEIQDGLGELDSYRTIEVITNTHLHPELNI